MLSADERYRLLEEASGLVQRRDFRKVLNLLDGVPSDDLLKEPELGYLFAQAKHGCGETDEAFVLIRALEQPCILRGRDRLYCRRLLFEGNMRLWVGELEEAADDYSEVLSLAALADDQRLVAGATMNLATVAWLQCDYAAALTSYERAIVAYETLGDEYKLAGCHHNLAMVYKELGLFKESTIHFDASRALYMSSGASRELALNSYERALVMHLSGQSDSAEAAARKALAALLEEGAGSEKGEALRVLGIIHRDVGRLSEAAGEFESALKIARAHSAKLLEAEIYEESALLANQMGDPEGTKARIDSAAKLYHSMGSPTRAARARARVRSANSLPYGGE